MYKHDCASCGAFRFIEMIAPLVGRLESQAKDHSLCMRLLDFVLELYEACMIKFIVCFL